MTPPLRRAAPALDGLCMVVFVIAGRDQHALDGGAAWFFTVLWPIALGWFAVALASRLYVAPDRMWLRWATTLVAGVLITSALRASFTDRAAFSAFTIVMLCFLGTSTALWRALAGRLQRRRPTSRVTRSV